MKLFNSLAFLSLAAANLGLALASPSSANAQLSSGAAPVLAQLFPGVISAVAQLSPTAAQNVSDALKQACDSVKDLKTDDAQIAQESTSILSPITSTISSIVSAAVPNLAAFVTAVLAVARGDPSAAPTLVAVAQQACDIAFNGAVVNSRVLTTFFMASSLLGSKSKMVQIGKQIAYIEKLPVEVLEIIFKIIHDDSESLLSVQRFNAGLSMSEIDVELLDADDNDDLFDTGVEVSNFLSSQQSMVFRASLSTTFPTCVAGVCKDWEAVLSNTPAFWTRVIFPVSRQTSLEAIGRHLACSHNRPIDVFILSEYGIEDCDKSTERELVHSFITFLRPHMERCRSLQMNLKYNSSLPSLSKIVPNHSSLLRALDIHYSFEDPDSEYHDEEELSYEELEDENPQADFPRLFYMKLDSRSFRQVLDDPPDGFSLQPQLRHLEISGFSAPGYELPLEDTARTISRLCRSSLTSLCLSRIKLDFQFRHVSRPPNSLCNFDRVQALYLGEIDPDAIEELLDLCIFNNLMMLNLSDCAGVRPCIFDKISSIVCMLVLDRFAMTKNEMDPDTGKITPHADMIHLLSNWHGIVLSLSASSIPFDDVFTALGNPSPRRHTLFPGESNFLCPNMQKLLIADCPGASFEAVKGMIEKRNKCINYRDPLWRQKDYEAPVIMEFEIEFSWPKWTREQMDWMKERIPDFKWLDV